jgi:hypothetical protein
MREWFWRQVAKANAALFMLLAAAVLLAALVWMLRPLQQGPAMMPGGAAPEGPFEAAPPWDAAPSVIPPSPPVPADANPFSSAWLQAELEAQRRRARLDAERMAAARAAAERAASERAEATKRAAAERRRADQIEAEKAAARKPPPPAPPPPAPERQSAPKPAPAPPPTPRAMDVLYRGMITRLDGTRLALIVVGGREPGIYRPAGDRVGWATIRSFDRATLVLSDGPARHAIPRGEPMTITESTTDEQ